MDKFFKLGNEYAKKSTWKDYALTKFCLCSMGVMIGASLPKKYRKEAIAIAGTVFAATYVPLMAKVAKTAIEMKEK